MTKRAAIYIRVSTEQQAEKASPQEQEKDCRALCERQGYTVVDVYSDTEKYRVGKRLVEPSGTRGDRPQFRRMLAAADAGTVDVVIAWKEDRLYRSYRPMLDFLECVEHNKLAVELVKEHFDATIAPVKAWAARLELQAKSERTAMGRAARLAAGKVHPGIVAFGWRSNAGTVEIFEDEAVWVRRIFEWYVAGVSVAEIRRRLIEQGAPQRGATSFGKGKLPVPWAKGVLQKLLTNPTYWTGRTSVTLASGKRFDLIYPTIIPASLGLQVADRRRMNKSHHLRNVKHTYLLAGMVYCARCGVKMGGKARRNRDGSDRLAYTCQYHNAGYANGDDSGCCRTVSASKLDADVWEKTWRLVSDDAFFSARVREKVDELRAAELNAEAEVAGLSSALDDILLQRQKVMNWALAGKITEADMETKLAALSFEEAGLKRELADKSLLVGNRADKLLAFAQRYREKLRRGGDFLNAEPTSPEMAAEQFAIRREILEAIVTRIEVGPDKLAAVDFLLLDQDAVGDLDNSRLREFAGPHPTLMDRWKWGQLKFTA